MQKTGNIAGFCNKKLQTNTHEDCEKLITISKALRNSLQAVMFSLFELVSLTKFYLGLKGY
jgi:hypothetical protein